MSREVASQFLDSDKVWDILVAHAGANESERDDFRESWPECHEYRFRGFLGIGGKIWNDHDTRKAPFVSFYPEDATPNRVEVRKAVNARLRALWGKASPA
jgi:hypothetical protein